MQVPRLKAQAVQRVLQSLADTYAAGAQGGAPRWLLSLGLQLKRPPHGLV